MSQLVYKGYWRLDYSLVSNHSKDIFCMNPDCDEIKYHRSDIVSGSDFFALIDLSGQTRNRSYFEMIYES